jgi:two-component system sensor histidine kinase QseC
MTSPVSLRRRLTWYVVLVLFVMTAAYGVAVYKGTQHEADEVFSASLVQTARILDGLITRAEIEINREQLKNALEAPEAHRYERKMFFAVLDADGKVLLHSQRAPDLGDRAIEEGFSQFRYRDQKWFVFALPSSHDDLFIIVGELSGAREEITEYIGGGLLLPLILLLPLVLWLLWQVVGVALKPLDEVAQQVRSQDIKRLRPVDAAGVPREIDPLVTALNQMIENLDAAYARERRFVSDASHELRNPLASLLINVDNALEECRDSETADTLRSMKASIKRLSHLVSQLLALSHYENPLSGLTLEPVDFGSLCRRVVDGLSSQAREAGVEIETCIDASDLEMRGDEALLSSLVTNLVDNAIKHAGRGARVRLSCGRQANSLLLAVEDSGAGLDAGLRNRVMERFYRAADTNTAGAGLGLSIVETIADLYDARVELGESELGGLAVRVRFDII